MLPEICHIGPFTVYSYGLTLVFAFFIGTKLASLQAKREGMDPQVIFNLLFYVFIAGILGARAFYILNNLGFYLRHPVEIFMLQHGGMAWFGSVILGSFCAVFFIKKHKLDLFRTLDLLVPFVALGQSIGRIGCLLNGCCYGLPGESGIYFRSLDQILIPTQLYSSAILILIFLILRFIQDRKPLAGVVLGSYLFLYSLKRFFMEFLRNDTQRGYFGLTIFQLLSIALFVLSLFVFARIFYKKTK